MAKQDKNTKRTTVIIAGRSYPVKVSEVEARLIPIIEKKINDQILEIQMSYKNLDIQDCISMVLLTNTMSESNNDSQDITGISEKLDTINATLETAL